jgi:hypothetical protein
MALPLKPTPRVLTDLTQSAPTMAELMAMIQSQAAMITELQASGTKRAIGFKVSEKGCVTITGTGQFGTTLYASQWATILDNAPALAAFITANADKLSFKTPEQHASTLASVKAFSA